MVDAYSGFVRNVKRADEAIRLQPDKFTKFLLQNKYYNLLNIQIILTEANHSPSKSKMATMGFDRSPRR